MSQHGEPRLEAEDSRLSLSWKAGPEATQSGVGTKVCLFTERKNVYRSPRKAELSLLEGNFKVIGSKFSPASKPSNGSRCYFRNSYNCDHDWRRQWHPTPVLLPGKSHGRKSMVGCSPWGRSESDTTERLHFHISLSCIGGGNGNPLQCSCLENPRDGRTWWAAIYGVAQVGHD